MVKKLRWKFVVVTMSLMTCIFGIALITSYLYDSYWITQASIYSLEDYAGNESYFDGSDTKIMDYIGEPVYLYTFDDDMNVKECSSSVSATDIPPKDVLTAILAKGEKNGTYHSYIYVIKDADDGLRMVITDMSDTKSSMYKKIGNVLLFVVVFFIAALISLRLSRYVTRPAEQALEREKRFISDASHELKTPLSAIAINAQALQLTLPDNKHIKYIVSEADRMNQLIQDLLKLSYLDEAGSDADRVVFNLSKCCKEMALTMESVMFEEDINYSYGIANNISYKGNESQIRQLIAILIDNAIKHTPAGGEIKLDVMKGDGSAIIIEVANSGKGINPEELPHIFDRFYRTDKSRQSNVSEEGKNVNYGLGLSIAKTIVDAHGGQIKAVSEYGKWTKFIVSL